MVDELQIWPHARHPCFKQGSAHLTTDGDVDELHAFAARLGLKRSWFQPKSSPHYDLSISKRAEAIALGAIIVPAREQARQRIARRSSLPSSESANVSKASEENETP